MEKAKWNADSTPSFKCELPMYTVYITHMCPTWRKWTHTCGARNNESRPSRLLVPISKKTKQPTGTYLAHIAPHFGFGMDPADVTMFVAGDVSISVACQVWSKLLKKKKKICPLQITGEKQILLTHKNVNLNLLFPKCNWIFSGSLAIFKANGA